MHFFLAQVYRGLKSCTSPLENVSLHVPILHVRDLSTYGVCPSARRSYAANVMAKNLYKVKT
jgi:hypothetical protein